MKELDRQLFISIHKNDLKGFKSLVERGANIHVKNRWKSSPIHATAAYQKPEILMYLIQKGAEINARNKYNRTPLSLTTPESACGKILIEHGATI